jgi:hypothetical protein
MIEHFLLYTFVAPILDLIQFIGMITCWAGVGLFALFCRGELGSMDSESSDYGKESRDAFEYEDQNNIYNPSTFAYRLFHQND